MVNSRHKGGYTLIEVTIAVLILGTLFSAFWLSIGSGMRGFYRGTSHVTGLQDTLVLIERLELDIDMMATPPSVLTTPVDIENNGESLKFAVAVFEDGDPSKTDLLDPVETKWVEYYLTEDKQRKGIFHPVRNGYVFRNVDVRSWSFEVGQNDDADGGMQFLSIELEVDGVFNRKPFKISRRKELVAATMAARYAEKYPYVAQFVAEPSRSTAPTTSTSSIMARSVSDLEVVELNPTFEEEE